MENLEREYDQILAKNREDGDGIHNIYDGCQFIGEPKRTYRLGGNVYNVPYEAYTALDQFLKEAKIPTILDGHFVPANLRSYSFTIMLTEYAERHWKEYKED